MQDFIREVCPNKINKEWVLWAFHCVIQADCAGDKISPNFLRICQVGNGKIMKLDPIYGVFNCNKEDIEPEME